MAFTFKQFHIDDLSCGMPVSTDAVILGALAPLGNAKRILDIGAGSGLLSLMATQRSQAKVIAVELDDLAAKACSANFKASPWADRLSLFHGNITQFTAGLNTTGLSKEGELNKVEVAADTKSLDRTDIEVAHTLFDHIICNPPYFDNGPQSTSQERAKARHTDTLSFDVLLVQIERLLSPCGIATMILPQGSMASFTRALTASSLEIVATTAVSSTPTKPSHRQVFCLAKAPHTEYLLPEQLLIRDPAGQYTPQMKQLTKDFYLKL